MSQDEPTAPDDATAVYHSSTAPMHMPIEESIEIPGYRVEKRLGEGGMGAVYLAEDLALGRKVAIKVVSGRIASDPDVRARFLREARLLATVEHPNVVRVYSFGTIGDRPYLVMEYIEGETLATRLVREGAMPVDTALPILREIVDALAAAWAKRIVHRDIKPSNILFDPRGRLKVADFGLAKGVDTASSDASLTQTGYLLGSPHYVAPEQAQGHDVDFRADIYSLGIVLYEMLTRRKPFEAASALAIVAKHLHESLPPIRAVRKEIPAEIETLLAWLTAKDRNERPASYADLLAVLPSETTREISAPRIGPPRRRRRIAAALMLIAAVLLGGTLAWQRLAPRASDSVAKTASDGRLVIAVAPFNGVDAESSREGRVMASLVEREIVRRMRDRVKVLGVGETNTAVRDTDAARALGERLGATLVIWGDAWVFRGEAEIQPSLTIIPRRRDGHSHEAHAMPSEDPFFEMARPAVRVATEAPNQIELRKTSAEGIGDLVVLAVSTQLLHEQNDPEAALELLSALRPTPDARLQRARSLLHLGRRDDARRELERAIAVDPKHAASRAMLADLALRDRQYLVATEHLNAVGGPVTAATGAIYDGKLYVAEQFFDGEQHRLVPAMLAVDAVSGRVLERYWLPGAPVAFTVEENALVIRYNAAENNTPPRIETVRFNGSRFDPPRHLPAATSSRRVPRAARSRSHDLGDSARVPHGCRHAKIDDRPETAVSLRPDGCRDSERPEDLRGAGNGARKRDRARSDATGSPRVSRSRAARVRPACGRGADDPSRVHRRSSGDSVLPVFVARAAARGVRAARVGRSRACAGVAAAPHASGSDLVDVHLRASDQRAAHARSYLAQPLGFRSIAAFPVVATRARAQRHGAGDGSLRVRDVGSLLRIEERCAERGDRAKTGAAGDRARADEVDGNRGCLVSGDLRGCDRRRADAGRLHHARAARARADHTRSAHRALRSSRDVPAVRLRADGGVPQDQGDVERADRSQ